MDWEESAPLYPHSFWALYQAGPQPSVLSAPQEQRSAQCCDHTTEAEHLGPGLRRH